LTSTTPFFKVAVRTFLVAKGIVVRCRSVRCATTGVVAEGEGGVEAVAEELGEGLLVADAVGDADADTDADADAESLAVAVADAVADAEGSTRGPAVAAANVIVAALPLAASACTSVTPIPAAATKATPPTTHCSLRRTARARRSSLIAVLPPQGKVKTSRQ
jgi:hypothetical protein